MKPPLNLKYHFYPHIHVVADVNIVKNVKPDSEFGYDFSTEVEVGQAQENPLEYQVQLMIKSAPTEGKIKGYDIELSVIGFVEADNAYPEEQRNGMISVVAASLLYGAARDFLLNLTSRGPFPPVYLPTISFIPDNNDNGNSEKADAVEE